jgi:hypothetical protein
VTRNTGSNLLTAINSQLSAVLLGSNDEIRSVVAAATAAINFVPCSRSPNCASLHRLNCSSTANTCGACISSLYAGEPGDSNSFCYLLPQSSAQVAPKSLGFDTLNLSCATYVDCGDFQSCVHERCAIEPKSCPSSCSGNGTCFYYNVYTGLNVSTCLNGDASCAASCLCDAGFAGSSCSLTAAEMASNQATRLALINALYNLTTKDDISDSVVVSWLTNLYSLTSSTYELSTDAMSSVSLIANTICSSAISLGLSYEDLSPILSVADHVTTAYNKLLLDNSTTATASIVDSSERRRRLDTSTQTSDNIRAMIYSFAEIVFDSIIAGQDDISIVQSQLRLIIASTSRSSLLSSTASNWVLSLPENSIEVYNGIALSSVSVNANSLGSSTTQVNLMIGYISVYSLGIEAAKTLLATPIFIATNSLSSQDVVIANISLPNFEEISYLGKPTEPTQYITDCAVGSRTSVTYDCPTGLTVTAQCNGSFVGQITSTCPIAYSLPYCTDISEDISQTANSVDYSEVIGSCSGNDYDSTFTQCRCPLELSSYYDLPGSSGSIQRAEVTAFKQTNIEYFSSMSQTFYPTSTPTSYPTSPVFSLRHTIVEFLRQNIAILVAVAGSIICLLIAVVACVLVRRARKQKLTSDKLDSLGITWQHGDASALDRQETGQDSNFRYDNPMANANAKERRQVKLANLTISIAAGQARNELLRQQLDLPASVMPSRLGQMLLHPEAILNNDTDYKYVTTFYEQLSAENDRFTQIFNRRSHKIANLPAPVSPSADAVVQASPPRQDAAESPESKTQGDSKIHTGGADAAEESFWRALGENDATGDNTPIPMITPSHPRQILKPLVRTGFQTLNSTNTNVTAAESDSQSPQQVEQHQTPVRKERDHFHMYPSNAASFFESPVFREPTEGHAGKDDDDAFLSTVGGPTAPLAEQAIASSVPPTELDFDTSHNAISEAATRSVENRRDLTKLLGRLPVRKITIPVGAGSSTDERQSRARRKISIQDNSFYVRNQDVMEENKRKLMGSSAYVRSNILSRAPAGSDQSAHENSLPRTTLIYHDDSDEIPQPGDSVVSPPQPAATVTGASAGAGVGILSPRSFRVRMDITSLNVLPTPWNSSSSSSLATPAPVPQLAQSAPLPRPSQLTRSLSSSQRTRLSASMENDRTPAVRPAPTAPSSFRVQSSGQLPRSPKAADSATPSSLSTGVSRQASQLPPEPHRLIREPSVRSQARSSAKARNRNVENDFKF